MHPSETEGASMAGAVVEEGTESSFLEHKIGNKLKELGLGLGSVR